MNTDLAQLAHDRYEIADTLHRYAFGLDHGDADSLASAFTEDCIFDFRPAGRKLKIDFPKLNGREAIVNALIPFLGPLDTSHTVSNLQIEASDDSATLYAYVMSQHFMPREGCQAGSENALLMNRYDCELVATARNGALSGSRLIMPGHKAIRKFLTPSRFAAL